MTNEDQLTKSKKAGKVTHEEYNKIVQL